MNIIKFKVFVDFDGTITKVDVGEAIFREFGNASETDVIVADLLSGRITARRCWELLFTTIELFCPPVKPLEVCPPCFPEGILSFCCLYDGVMQRVMPSCDLCKPNVETSDVWIYCADTSSLPHGTSPCYPAKRVMPSYVATVNIGTEGEPIWVTEARPVYNIPVCGCGCPKDRLRLTFTSPVEGWYELDWIPPPPGTADKVLVNPCQIDGVSVTFDLETLDESTEESCIYSFFGCFCHEWRVPVYLISALAHIRKPRGLPPPDDWEDVPEYPVLIKPNCLTGEIDEIFLPADDVDASYCGHIPFDSSGWEMIGDPWWDVNSTCLIGLEWCHNVAYPGVESECTGPIGLFCNMMWQDCDFCYRLFGRCEDGTITLLQLQQVIPPGNPNYGGMGVNEEPGESMT